MICWRSEYGFGVVALALLVVGSGVASLVAWAIGLSLDGALVPIGAGSALVGGLALGAVLIRHERARAEQLHALLSAAVRLRNGELAARAGLDQPASDVGRLATAF